MFDQRYNPQFQYQNLPAVEQLEKYRQVSIRFLPLAEKILEQYVPKKPSKPLSLDQLKKLVNEYLTAMNLNSIVSIQYYRGDEIKRTAVIGKTVRFSSKPNDYFEDQIQAVFEHEIGTHALRRINHDTQPWAKQASVFPNYLLTEEGLALLNSMVVTGEILPFRSALNFSAVCLASHHSFADLAKSLKPYIPDLSKRFKKCLNCKRGMIDTSEPGAFSKDQVYLAGLIAVLGWILKHPQDFWKLYLGKISIDDIESLSSHQDLNRDPLLPLVYTRDPDAYIEHCKKISVALKKLDPTAFK